MLTSREKSKKRLLKGIIRRKKSETILEKKEKKTIMKLFQVFDFKLISVNVNFPSNTTYDTQVVTKNII